MRVETAHFDKYFHFFGFSNSKFAISVLQEGCRSAMGIRGVTEDGAGIPGRNARCLSGERAVQEDRGGGDLCGRLSRKIRSQAGQLAELTERLQQQEAYSRLVEARLLQLNPAHPLPVAPGHLNCDAAAVPIQQQASSVAGAGRHHPECGPRGAGDDENCLRQGYEAAQARLKDAAQLIRQLKEALTTRYEPEGGEGAHQV